MIDKKDKVLFEIVCKNILFIIFLPELVNFWIIKD